MLKMVGTLDLKISNLWEGMYYEKAFLAEKTQLYKS